MKISEMSNHDVLVRMGDCTVEDAAHMLDILRRRFYDASTDDISHDEWLAMCAEACKA